MSAKRGSLKGFSNSLKICKGRGDGGGGDTALAISRDSVPSRPSWLSSCPSFVCSTRVSRFLRRRACRCTLHHSGGGGSKPCNWFAEKSARRSEGALQKVAGRRGPRWFSERSTSSSKGSLKSRDRNMEESVWSRDEEKEAASFSLSVGCASCCGVVVALLRKSQPAHRSMAKFFHPFSGRISCGILSSSSHSFARPPSVPPPRFPPSPPSSSFPPSSLAPTRRPPPLPPSPGRHNSRVVSSVSFGLLDFPRDRADEGV